MSDAVSGTVLRDMIEQLTICPTCSCYWRSSPPAGIQNADGSPTGQVRCVHCKAVYDDPQTIASIVSELIARREADEWQPIETAPKDGTHVLVCFDGTMTPPTVAHWFGPPPLPGLRAGAWYLSVQQLEGPSISPTRWRPMPKPPVER